MSQDDDLERCRQPFFDDFDEWCCPSWNNPCPQVYGQFQALFLQRIPRYSHRPIVVDDTTGTTLLSTSDLDFHFNPGVQATVGLRLGDGQALEFSYFGLLEGSTSVAVATPGPAAVLILGDNLFGNVFVDMNRAEVSYRSWVHSFAVNFPGCCECCDEFCGGVEVGDDRCQSVEWFAGFRYLNLGEKLNINVQGVVPGEVGSYNIRTHNNLYGAQLGARLRRSRGRFGWDATGLAGLFGNDAQQSQSVINYPGVPLRNVSSSRGQVAFLSEANLSAFYRLTEVWNFRTGYNALWIDGLALAPDQLDFNFAAAQGGSQLHNGGGMFLHGINVGLEARW